VAVVKIQADGVPTELAYRVCNVVNDTTGHVTFDPVGQAFEVDGDASEEFATRNFTLLVGEIGKLLSDQLITARTCEFKWGGLRASVFIESVKRAHANPDEKPWILYENGCISIRHNRATIASIVAMLDAFDSCMGTKTNGKKSELLVKLLGNGITRHRDVLPRMHMATEDFNRLVKHMIKSGTILAHKEGRGTAYSLKGSE
jgi:hypothetical protein